MIILLWGGKVENFWISIASVFGIIAIGFFATWSFLSNILAGFILLFSKYFNIDDEIEIMVDNIKGQVKTVTLMFTILEDKKGNQFQIPNNILMQRIVKTYKSKP